MPTLNPFESAKHQLAWAREDFDKFRTEARAFLDNQSYTELVEMNPQTGRNEHKIRLDAAPLPSILRKLASSIVIWLKNALDQAMFAAVAVVEGALPKGDIYFPFATNLIDLDHRFEKGKYKIIPHELRSVVYRFKPYPCRDSRSGGDDLLCALSAAAGPNKHQIALQVLASASVTSFALHQEVGGLSLDFSWNRRTSELLLMQYEPSAKFEYKFQVTLQIAFADIKGLNGEPAERAFGYLLCTVDDIVHALEDGASEIIAARGG